MASKKTGRRHKSEGGIRQRDAAGKTWELTYNVVSGSGSRRKRGYETVHGTYADAARRLREIQASLDHGTYVRNTNESTADFLRYWLKAYASTNTNPRTAYGYERIIEFQIIPQIGDVPLVSLRPDHIVALHQALFGRGLAAQTVLHVHRVLSEALKHAVRWQRINVNPADNVDAPKPRRKEMTTLSWDEVGAFFAAIEGSPYRDFYYADLYLGMRRSELLGLQWPEVNLDAPQPTAVVKHGLQRIKGRGLMLLPTKTKLSHRVVDLQTEVAELFRAIKVRQMEAALKNGGQFNHEGFVFARLDGRPYAPDQVSREFVRIRRSSGLPYIRLHDLRHTMASLMLADNTPIEVVQRRLGHATITTTIDTYRHLLPGEQAHHAERMAQRLRGA